MPIVNNIRNMGELAVLAWNLKDKTKAVDTWDIRETTKYDAAIGF